MGAGASLAATKTTWYVSASASANPACSAASSTNPFATVAGALACAKSGDTVDVGAGVFAGGFTVAANVVLEGAGANQTTISDPTYLGTPEVTVAPGTSATIEGLAVNGASHNGGIASGSGSLVLEKATVTNTIDGSSSDPAPVAVMPASGNASLTVLSSTISDNSGDFSGGIAIVGGTVASTATAINSTVSGNQGDALAGGVLLINSSLIARDDTIANNVGNEAGGLYLASGGVATVTDSLIATNTSNGPSNTADCWLTAANAKIVDGGHNLIGVASPGAHLDCGFANGTNGDVTGTPASPLNPELGALGNNGGPTQTQALLPGSPAISAGNPADCKAAPVNNVDQRGHSRGATARNTCDIGAYDTGGAA